MTTVLARLSERAATLGYERYEREGPKYLLACLRGEFGDLSKQAAEHWVADMHAEHPDHEGVAVRYIADHERVLFEAAGDDEERLRDEYADRRCDEMRDEREAA